MGILKKFFYFLFHFFLFLNLGISDIDLSSRETREIEDKKPSSFETTSDSPFFKICKKCILKESIRGISIGEDGVCNVCKNYKKIDYMGEKKLIEEIEKLKSKKRGEFDCIVTLSGGRDSSYVLLKAVKDYKLKVLAVHYENPFSTEIAEENIENITKELGVSIIKIREPIKTHRRLFIENLNIWAKNPDLSILPIMCVGCKPMWYHILKIAKKYKINFILSGGNRLENTSFKKILLNIPMEEKWETTYLKSISGIIKSIIKNPRYLKPKNIPVFLMAYLFGDPYSIGSRIFFPKIKKLDLFYYIQWDEKEIIKRLKNEVGWKYMEDISSWRFDCKIAFLKTFIYKNTIGITEKDDFLSIMIREGLISRDEAIKKIKKENTVPENFVNELLTEAKINRKKFESLLINTRKKV